MNLAEFTDSVVRTPQSLTPFAMIDPQASRITNDPERVEPTLATVAWRMVALTSFFEALLREFTREARTDIDLRQIMIVVPHGNTAVANYSLIVLNEHYRQTPRTTAINYDQFVRQDLEQGYRRWRSELEDSLRTGVLAAADRRVYQLMLQNITADFILSVLQKRTFHVVFARRPDVVLSTVPLNAWNVDALKGSPATSTESTAGAVVFDALRNIGVTVAYHAAGGSNIMVNGLTGIIRSVDPISDSCFVEVPGLSRPFKATNGPLRGVSPRQNESVTFEGISSGSGTSVVRGWTPNLLTPVRSAQRSIFTDDDIVPGDSGAAMLDAADNILGFAHYTTGGPSNTSFSAWIWAASVFDFHNVTPA